MRVFGRVYEDHPFHSPLQEWLAGVSAQRALAQNFIHDHRVSKEREEKFREFVGGTCSCDSFREGLRRYHATEVRAAIPPDFALDVFNRENLLSGAADGRHAINKDLELARVLDLSLLAFPFTWAKTQGNSLFRTFDGASERHVEQFLDAHLTYGQDAREEFLDEVLAVLAQYGQVEAYHPSWVTTWAAFEPYVSQPPERWIQSVGVERPDKHWLVVLRYRAREAGSLARPTQLDAGYYAYHFPSPPVALLGTGGHPVDLGPTTTEPLLPEFIHEQVSHQLDHWIAGGRRCAKTQQHRTLEIESARQRHYERLLGTYGTAVSDWMVTPL